MTQDVSHGQSISRTSAHMTRFRLIAAAVFLAASAQQARATTISFSPIDLNFTVAEQSPFSGAVAVFEDDNPSAGAGDFVATINWGDGNTTAGTIGSSSGAFTVLGNHTYADEGTFTVTVTVSDQPPGTGTNNVTYTAIVTEADVLAGTPLSFSAPSGVSFTADVAHFTDTLAAATVVDFVATINWGDATASAGTVTGGGGSFQVSGTHTYAGSGSFSVIVTLSEVAPGTATAQVTSTALVAAGAGVSVTVTSFSIPEGSPFNGMIATFSDSDTTKTPASFTAMINWGDATSSAGTVTGGSGSFTLNGVHTYIDEGSFPLIVVVTENPAGTTGTGTGTATVTEADVLTGTPMTFNPVATVPFTGPVATFADANTANVPSDFTATINWGDGNTTAGVVVSLSAGSFQVRGTHTYATNGTFSVIVTLTDDAPGTATATVTSTALVASHSVTVTVPGFSVAEATAFNGTVATFTDTDTTKTPASFTSIINWGDGMPTSAGTVTGASGSFTLTGQHTYADEGTFPVSVTVSENLPGTATGSGTGTATVTETDVLSGTPMTFTPVATVPFTGPVATFSDTNTANVPGDFTATINWGDGNTTAGTVTGGGASYTVSGTHTYATNGTFPVIVTLHDDPPGTATATANSTANVSAAPAAAPAVPALDFYGFLALGFALGIIAVIRLRGHA